MICFFIAIYTSAIDTLHIIYIKSSYIYIYKYVYVAGSTSIFFPRYMPIFLWQEPLPPPKVDAGIDVGMGDYELFQKFVLPNGGLCLLGDMWPDAPRRINDYLMIFFFG